MKATIFSILTVFALFNSISAQVSIQCPADVTVHAFDLDSNFESYGNPIVTSVGTSETDKAITVIDNNCNGQTVTINYTATENGTGNTAFCIQTISVTTPSLEDIQWPLDSYTLLTGTVEDLDPDNMTARPEPYEILKGATGSTIITAYEDLVISNGNQSPYKIVRTWTGLDWCTAETSTFSQVLKIDNLQGGVFGVLEVPTGNGTNTTVSEVNVTTDQPGFTLDLSNCTLDNDLLAYLNCVAENNAIESGSNFILDLVNNNDHLNGVSTLDMVLIQRHILGIQPLSSECNKLAADLTSDGRITAVDILTMRKLILGVIPELPFTSSWIFVNLYQESSTPVTVIDELDLKFPKYLFPLTELDIKAIKVGDVNGSASN